eukprot:TRINITY_DN1249_c0_g1_i1.p1 TRINITY_DN1249_c0_g1~~TRINITY_DN1249_c0_g1_i1.p1  ORF type:complete len:871 (-),score=344.62 TRINITY_DN1249_c0_g1_i1:153-2765(-)
MSKIQLKPDQYIHILNRNTNTSFVVVGPINFHPEEHEQVIFGPADCIRLAPTDYARIKNPVVEDQVFSKTEQPKLKYGEMQIRFYTGETFPLYPGEALLEIERMPIIGSDQAAKIVVENDYEYDDEEGNKQTRLAGEEYLIQGPQTYIPRIEEYMQQIVEPIIIDENQAIRVRAKTTCIDYQGVERSPNEYWLVRQTGAYLLGAYEELIDFVNSVTLTDAMALHIQATQSFHDEVFGIDRRPGEQWLVTHEHTATYLPDVCEKIISYVDITIVKPNQYVVILEPFDEESRTPHLGGRELREGPCTFFLHPNEELEGGCVQDVRVLEVGEAALVRAISAISVEQLNEMGIDSKEEYEAGHVWMVNGPLAFVPPVDVEVIEYRSTIPLGDNEGVYVRNIRTGEVRAEMGKSYLLQSHEVLWEKPLSRRVEELLRNGGATGDEDIRKVAYFKSYVDSNADGERDRTKVIVYKCPHNCAVQLYDYMQKTARVVFGPDLVILGPHEEFTVLSLSAGVPKRSNALKSVALMLGPDYITDTFDVETSDHARLRLHLAYNNFFRVDQEDPESVSRIFNIPDFIGDACKTCSAMIRGAIAKQTFEDFHKNSAFIIRESLFGSENGKIGKEYEFQDNGLVITNVDIRAIDPVDRNMQESLQKSVQMAIDISTSLLEAQSQHRAAEVNQQSMGQLEMQKYENRIFEEKERKLLKEIVAANNEVDKVGRARCETEASTIAVTMELEGAVKLSQMRADAKRIIFEAELDKISKQNQQDFEFKEEAMKLEIAREQELAEIEVGKLDRMCEIIGRDTVLDIASAGAETKQKLVDGLGLRDFLMPEGKMPVNLFGTIEALLGESMDNASSSNQIGYESSEYDSDEE